VAKLRVDRVISIATLVVSVVAVFLVLHRTKPEVSNSAPAARPGAETAPVERNVEPAQLQDQPASELHLNSQEVYSAVAQAMASLGSKAPGGSEQGAKDLLPSPVLPQATNSQAGKTRTPSEGSTPAAGLDENTLAGDLGSGEPNIKDYSVNMEGDQVVGKFLTQVAGKDVWVTVRGHMGCKDGYATFDPTEFKVGDINVPVSLVNDQLQKKLAEQRSRMSCGGQ
jgi:hypothetical protein